MPSRIAIILDGKRQLTLCLSSDGCRDQESKVSEEAKMVGIEACVFGRQRNAGCVQITRVLPSTNRTYTGQSFVDGGFEPEL